MKEIVRNWEELAISGHSLGACPIGHPGAPPPAIDPERAIMYLSIKVIRIAVAAALPRIAGDASKVARWADLFAGWLAPSTGKATAITAPTTGTASNVARRAWKNNAKLKGTVSVPLARWNYGDLLVKRSTAIPTVASQRIAITQNIDKVIAALPDCDGDPNVAVSVDPHDEGVIVTAYWRDHGPVRDGG